MKTGANSIVPLLLVTDPHNKAAVHTHTRTVPSVTAVLLRSESRLHVKLHRVTQPTPPCTSTCTGRQRDKQWKLNEMIKRTHKHTHQHAQYALAKVSWGWLSALITESRSTKAAAGAKLVASTSTPVDEDPSFTGRYPSPQSRFILDP